MRHKLIAVILLSTLAGSSGLWAQISPRQVPAELRGQYSSVEEIVSLSKSTSFTQALQIFNELSKKFLGKVIIDAEGHNFQIGLSIQRTHWLTAMEMILREHNLWYQEGADFIMVVSTGEEEVPLVSKAEQYADDTFNTREVQISAVFFEADLAKLRSAGMNWSVTRGKGVNLGVSSNPVNESGVFEIDFAPGLDWGSISTLFASLENDEIGEVISSPQVTVRSGELGRIQVGSDIAVTVNDFAGNTVTQFFSTGSIINVRPEIIQYDSVDFVNLVMDVERSSSSGGGGGNQGGGNQGGDQGGGGGLAIDRSSAKTTVLLLDGEETIIGGLYINQVDKTRTGIPFLKDLPWWFFGLRYVFGNETVSVTKKELLILVKAELLPSLGERLAAKNRGRIRRANLPEERRKQSLKMKYYQDILKQPK